MLEFALAKRQPGITAWGNIRARMHASSEETIMKLIHLARIVDAEQQIRVTGGRTILQRADCA